MKPITIASLASVLVVSSLPLSGAHIWQDHREWASSAFSYDRKSGPLYSANELSLDLGGSYTAGQRGVENLFETSIKGQRGRWGGGVGLNYFFTQQVGVGVDANMADNGGNLVDAVAANLIVRFPLGNSGVAPYLFGGGGRTTDRQWDWMGQAGVGLEFRLNRTVGIYTDGRYQWPENVGDSLLLRTGLRINF
ncbi:MAG: hypothetical protein JNN07_17310 [Verrucomicrobiales bacterium]|nr:hypothetical protein [Verrucomicrobiales bacterium]